VGFSGQRPGGYLLIYVFSPINLLGVCCASRLKSKKIADQAIFYPANSVEPKVRSTPDNRGFCGTKWRKNLQVQQAARE
jgi:hypothetical protein